MTVRRTSFLVLVGIVFGFWIAAVGCSLDGSGFGEADEVCTLAAHCDDGNICSIDTCGADGVCVHTPVEDGRYPDGVTGNCKQIECKAGESAVVPFLQDVDDGSECTQDSCDPSGTATHQNINGGVCHLLGARGVCDANGECVVECGQLDADGNEVTCPASDDKCTVSYCDKAQGVCVLDKLDGVAWPDAVPGQCGGSYCVDGKKTDVYAAEGTSCAGAGDEKFCDGAGTCVECNGADDCNPDMIPLGFCFNAACVDNQCQITEQPDGTVLPAAQQIAADCLELRCLTKVQAPFPLVTDVPDDGNKCTTDSCNADGTKKFENTASGSLCGQNDDLFCNGNGACVGCLDPGQCGTATDCFLYTCVNNTCGTSFPADGTPLPAVKQTTGDCKLQVCDGAGGVKPQNDDVDLPNDNNDCTQNQCVNGSVMHPPVGAGATCSGNRVCDAGGHCLGNTCSSMADCVAGAYCVDGVCCNALCDTTCAACTIALKGNGLEGDCGTSASGTDGGDLDCPGAKVCNGTTGNNACKLPIAELCSTGGECLSGNCVDGYCCNSGCGGTCQACNLAGTLGLCTPIPAGQDPSNECVGSVNCNGGSGCGSLFGPGVACSTGAECASGNCIDGVCCLTACGGTCQACNVAGSLGTCTNYLTETDPANECNGAASVCNGAAACKIPLGNACSVAGDCASGFCVDGVCCNAACGGTCKACNVSGSVGSCVNIPAGQDPASECPGSTSCSAGACLLFANGAGCAAANECSSNFCVDGVCCQSACNALCKVCAAGTGSCNNITAGQDPANECNGAQVCSGGACAGGPPGAACVANSECASGNCVDGVCCSTACNAPCQVCNATPGTCTSIPMNTDPANECPGATVCSGGASCALFANGTVCTLGTECLSGNCIDGYCCNGTCGQACKACDVAGFLGSCTDVPANSDPHNDCTGAIECNGAGACEAANGAMCTQGSQCTSGNCVDGVCCNSACGSACQACNIGGSVGTCSNIAAGAEDNSPVGACTGINSCDGAGGCKKDNGQTCTLGTECSSGSCADGVCCNNTCGGTCEACDLVGTVGTCTNLPTNTDPSDLECPGAQVCGMMGTCVDGQNGATCPVNGPDLDCASDVCVDGVCCNNACTGACQACTAALKASGPDGTCGAVMSGQDPDNDCPGAGEPPCNNAVCQ